MILWRRDADNCGAGAVAVGFDAQAMADTPYALVVTTDGAVVQQRLGDHYAGSALGAGSLTVLSNTVAWARSATKSLDAP